jgi:hypothetical protein
MFENIQLNKHEMQETQIRDVHIQNLFYEPCFLYKSTVPGRPVESTAVYLDTAVDLL